MKHELTNTMKIEPDKPSLAEMQAPNAEAMSVSHHLLNDKLIDDIAKLVAQGIPARKAMALLGCSRHWIAGWLNNAQRDIKNDTPSIYAKLYEAIERAIASFVKDRMENLLAQEHNNWQISKYLLEKIDPEDFGAETIKVQVDTSSGMEDKLSNLTEEELKTLISLNNKVYEGSV